MKVIKNLLFQFATLLAIWAVISLIASDFRANRIRVIDGKLEVYDNCDKRYPIDYVLATRLFCPLEDKPE